MGPTSRSLPLGSLAVVAVVVGPLGARLGVLPPMVGFVVFLAAGVVGLLAVVWGIASKRKGVSRGGAMGALIGGAPLMAVAIPAIVELGGGHPRINDITTDTADPPAFLASTDHGDYPRAFVDVARRAYPDIGPLELDVPASRARALALDEARDRGWEVVATADDGFEAVDRSRVFRFRDDVVVRVRAAGAGAVVDVRSASRDGSGDFGVNAARIASFLEAVAQRAR